MNFIFPGIITFSHFKRKTYSTQTTQTTAAMKATSRTLTAVTLALLLSFSTLIGTVQCAELSKEEKHKRAVEAMENKLKNIKLNDQGRSLPFIVNGPNGETLFIVKYSDGSYKTSPTGVPVSPSPDDITRWLFVQEDGSLGETPSPEYAEKIKKRAEKYHRVRRESGDSEEMGMEGSSGSGSSGSGSGYGHGSGRMRGVDKKRYNRQKYLDREKRIRKAQMRRKVEV